MVLIGGCHNSEKENTNKSQTTEEETPVDLPLNYLPELAPKDQLIHRGILSSTRDEYYYTLSDKNFEKFDIKYVRKVDNHWSSPKNAVINSAFSDHGMSFSPDGRYLYFSSTRPVDIPGVADTWHLWRSEKVDGEWTEPTFVDIPNLRDKLVSHPTISKSGELYFHSSNLDYSDMDIYYSTMVNGKFQKAKKAIIPMETEVNKCTPFISPDQGYLLFAAVGEQLDLMISFRNKEGRWTPALRLDKSINQNGQGNPSVTSDGKFLFFTTGTHSGTEEETNWTIKWVDMESVLLRLGIDLMDRDKVYNG